MRPSSAFSRELCGGHASFGTSFTVNRITELRNRVHGFEADLTFRTDEMSVEEIASIVESYVGKDPLLLLPSIRGAPADEGRLALRTAPRAPYAT